MLLPMPSLPLTATALFLLVAVASASGKPATRIIRFLDAAGTEHHGQPTDATLTAAHLIHGDIFGPRTLTGETAEVAKLLSPVRSTPAIYGVGCNYVGHCPIAFNPNPQFPVRVMTGGGDASRRARLTAPHTVPIAVQHRPVQDDIA